jgi:hypothetical protein
MATSVHESLQLLVRVNEAEAGKTEVQQACKVPAKAKRDVVDVVLSGAIS